MKTTKLDRTVKPAKSIRPVKSFSLKWSKEKLDLMNKCRNRKKLIIKEEGNKSEN